MLFLSGVALAGVIARPLRARAGDGEEEPRPTRRLRLRGKDLDCIQAVAFSADRTTLATAHADGAINLWDLGNGQERNSLAGEATDISFLAFADRAVVFRSGNGTARVWHPLTGETRTVLAKDDVSRRGLTATDVSADGKLLATVHDGGGCDTLVQVRDLAAKRDAVRFNNADGHEEVYALAFAPDGRTLALGDQTGAVKLLDAASGKPRVLLEGGRGSVGSLAWTADGKALAACVVRPPLPVTIRVWSVATGKGEAELAGFTAAVTDLAFSPDGRSLAASEGGSGRLTVWAPATGKRRAEVRIRGYRGSAVLADNHTLAVVREEPRIEEVVFFDLGRLEPSNPE
jgi:Tol biopolymer transport system component